jgi:hypothetical protein
MRIFFLFLFISSTLFADLNETICATKDVSQSFRKKVTRGYHRFLYGIDSYFSDSDDVNRSSYKKIRDSKLQLVVSLKDGKKLNLHLRGNIVLPQLKNRAELTFSQNDNQELDNQNSVSSNDDIVNDKKLRVGLKYYLYREKKSTAYAKIGFKLRSPFGPYLKLGMDKGYLSENFLETTFNHAIYYYLNGSDVAASTAVSFFKPISNDYWLGEGNKLYWEDDKAYLTNSLLLYQILDLNNRIVYKTAFTTSYDTKDRFAHDSFSVSSGYFHRFDKWFFIEAIPKFRKRRSNSYEDEFLFTLNFGMLLGR